ncbi:MAG: hypothetical protein SCARUB_04520 [Candidatus Scalindua rubra]|uniref:Phospholipase D-like domain-containing protein n=1 Tax=Candidatus Scalindua rubra TaxID=1872076 RepID=A0A1E3X407_9BACT|nr:MAG: hypothetical protein SCARUB_04520 [Candidatus Scalindua rubra]
MAKFLDTTGVSYHLEKLIKGANDRLILISPYLKFNDRIKELLDDKDRLKLDVRLIYGKNELQPEESNWLKDLKSIRSSFCKNLHAKCYLNENEAILTSMNLYEFSQQNNNEMGIYVTKENDTELYNEIYEESMRLVRISDEIQITISKVPKDPPKKTVFKKSKATPSSSSGHCIRCGTKIKLNPLVPYCKKHYNSWKKYQNPNYEEKHCHICGKENSSTIKMPACYPCFTSNKTKLKFPVGK